MYREGGTFYVVNLPKHKLPNLQTVKFLVCKGQRFGIWLCWFWQRIRLSLYLVGGVDNAFEAYLDDTYYFAIWRTPNISWPL